MGYSENRAGGKWWHYSRLVPSAYRLSAFAIAAARIFLFPSAHYSLISPPILAAGVGIYTLIKISSPPLEQRKGRLSPWILGADISVCIFLVISTGGLLSPFLLYAVCPVLTAGLLLTGRVTAVISGVSIAYVLGGHWGNPFIQTQFGLPELSNLLIYMVAIVLAAALPHLINVNLRQRLLFEDTLRERQRLSRELHDGVIQTVSALRWQVQLLCRRLSDMGVKLDEAKDLEELAEKAQRDTRESMELLRDYTGDGSFLSHLMDYLEHLRRDTNIAFNIDLDGYPDKLNLGALVELELLRICQEALTNVIKHARAHNVWIQAKREEGNLQVRIADDGSGFNVLDYYGDAPKATGRGLAVMQERALSINSRFRVLSTPGGGTEVQVEVPTSSR